MSHQRHLREDACAVDEHIDSAQIIVRTLDQRAYGVLRSHIDRSHCCANIVAAALVGAALQTLIDSLGEEQRAPSDAYATAIDRPMPLTAPGMSACLPSSCPWMCFLLSARPTDRQASVDDELLSRDIRRVVAGEEANAASDLVRVASASRRDDPARGLQARGPERVGLVEGLGLSIRPGITALIRMPRGASSTASERTSPSTPAFAAA